MQKLQEIFPERSQKSCYEFCASFRGICVRNVKCLTSCVIISFITACLRLTRSVNNRSFSAFPLDFFVFAIVLQISMRSRISRSSRVSLIQVPILLAKFAILQNECLGHRSKTTELLAWSLNSASVLLRSLLTSKSSRTAPVCKMPLTKIGLADIDVKDKRVLIR